jgi:hypothetical protein
MKKYAVWLTYGSFVLTSAVIILLFSCKQKGDITPKPTDDFLKVPEYKTEESARYTPTTTTYSTSDSSYWYVIVEDDSAQWHRTISLATPYFDFVEALKFFPCYGKSFFEFIIPITREGVKSFDIHKANNDKK